MAVTWATKTYGETDPGLVELAKGGSAGTFVSPATRANAERIIKQVDVASTAAGAAEAYRRETESVLGSSQKTLSDAYSNLKGVNSGLLKSLDGIINGDSGIDGFLQMATQNYGKINQYAEEAKAAADDITQSVTDVRKGAGDITNIANSLGEYAPLLKSMGESMFGDGGELIAAGKDYLGQGASLLSLDQSAGGLAGTYAKILAALDPTLAVSLAANETKSAFKTQLDAAKRNQARQGVTAGSGASAALEQQAAMALAASLAGIKTKTRQSANESYLAHLRGLVSDATSLGSTGSAITSQGVSAKAQGANAVESAAGILVSQGQLHASATNANAQAGQLRASQAGALTAAGQLEQAGGSLAISAATAKNNAVGNKIQAASVSGNIASGEFQAASKVADSAQSVASYYAGMFNQYATIASDKLFGKYR